MKKFRRLASVLLAMIMALALAVPAFATENNTGKITINNALKGQTYEIYRIFDLESYNSTSGAYSYTVNTSWEGFFAEGSAALNYVDISTDGYVTWKMKNESGDDIGAADFAKLALAYAAEHSINAVDSKVAGGENAEKDGTTVTVEFTGLALGYYLVDSSAGTLCSLNTTNPNAQITEKNEVPTLEKEVKENEKWGPTSDGKIGDTVEYKITVNAKAGAENYIVHDKLSDGLDFVQVTEVTLDGTTVTAEGNYTVNESPADGDTFDVAFTENFCNNLTDTSVIVIYYSATINENAVVAGVGNPNEAYLQYGPSDNSTSTPKKETKTYVWQFDVLKYTNGENGAETPLSGAKFVLRSQMSEDAPAITFNDVTAEGEDAVPTYQYAADGKVAEIETNASGKFVLTGLDSGTYYLYETAAPAGYNKLSGPIKIVITESVTTTPDAEKNSDNPSKGNITKTTIENGVEGTPEDVTTVKVLNQSGTILPDTGGIGTTIFYVVGGVLVLGAGVLLVTKKRMSSK